MIRFSSRLFSAALPLLLTASGFAGTVTVDFENLESPCNAAIVKQGIRLTNARGVICLSGTYSTSSPSNGTRTTNDAEGLVVTQTEGRTFTPVSVDLAEYSSVVPPPAELLIVGYKESGEMVSFSVVLDRQMDGPGGIEDFQTFTFPASFQDVVKVEFPGRLFTLDNLVISTVIPPDFPAEQKPGPGFSSASVIRRQSLSERLLIVSPWYSYKSGSFTPSALLYQTDKDSFYAGSAYGSSYDAGSGVAIYVSSGSVRSYDPVRKYQTQLASSLIEQAGFPVFVPSRAALDGSRLVTLITRSQNDAYAILDYQNDKLSPLVTEETDLPGPSGSTGKPYYFPDFLTARGGSYAFDTSLTGSYSTTRVYASFQGGPLQLVVSEGETTPLGVVSSFVDLTFDDAGQLVVSALAASRRFRLTYNAAGLVSTELLTLTIAPVNEGRTVTGVVTSGLGEPRILQTPDEIYRESGGQWFRVISQGDMVNGQVISYPKYLTTRTDDPSRIIVEARYPSDYDNAYHIELQMADPVEQPPRLGTPILHPESHELYIPVSHLTSGRVYTVQKSTDLTTWEDFQDLQEVLPSQFVRVLADQVVNPIFFRMKETKEEEDPQ